MSELVVPAHLKTTIAVAYVSGGMVHEEFMTSLLQLYGWDSQNRRCIAALIRHKGLYVAGLRNGVCRDFLKTKADYLFFLDTDMVFTPAQVYALLDAANPAEQPIVSGLYFTYFDDVILPVWHEHYEDGTLGTVRQIGPVARELAACGMGFTLIHRRVLEALDDPKEEWPWFGHDPMQTKEGPHRLGEDITFCLRAAAHGFKTWGIPIPVGHLKTRQVNIETFIKSVAGQSLN